MCTTRTVSGLIYIYAACIHKQDLTLTIFQPIFRFVISLILAAK